MGKPEVQWYELRDLAEILVVHADIHEGYWGPAFEFSSGGGLLPLPDGKGLIPSAIMGIKRVGLQEFPTPNNFTVDASLVNPNPSKQTKKPSKGPVKKAKRQ